MSFSTLLLTILQFLYQFCQIHGIASLDKDLVLLFQAFLDLFDHVLKLIFLSGLLEIIDMSEWEHLTR